jgi:SAM-dependent methyltransferase
MRVPRFWRRVTPVTSTDELRLIRRADGHGVTQIEVQALWSKGMAAVADEWADRTIVIGAHWLDRNGRVVQWDGPRTAPLNLARLRTTAQNRWLDLSARPAQAVAAAVEMVAEGRAWGSECGLGALRVVIGGRAPTLPPTFDLDARSADATDQACTDELRVVEIGQTASGLHVDVEVRWSDSLGHAVAGLTTQDVVLRAQWLDASGIPVESAIIIISSPLEAGWLELAPQVRRLLIGAQPELAHALRITITTGTDKGLASLEPLRIVMPDGSATRPAAVPARDHGPSAPREAPAETRAWLAAAFPEDADPDEMAAYVGADLARFLMSVQLMGDAPGAVLEIGANPYFISRLVRARFPESTLAMTNYFGFPGATITQRVVDRQGAEVGSFTSDLIDTEAQALPYDDGTFDTVLLCEVIEHLIQDPVFQLSEIARVLRPGGRLVLTTPNVARRTNRIRLAQREGIYDPYSRYGPHGRHNREYTASELFELTSGVGLTPVSYMTRPVHSVPEPDERWFRGEDDDGMGDYHFLVLEKTDTPSEPARPAWLYR